MARKIALTDSVRTFKSADRKHLVRATYLDTGSLFEIGEPQKMMYGEQEYDAVSFKLNDQTFYLLVSDLNQDQQAEILSGAPTSRSRH